MHAETVKDLVFCVSLGMLAVLMVANGACGLQLYSALIEEGKLERTGLPGFGTMTAMLDALGDENSPEVRRLARRYRRVFIAMAIWFLVIAAETNLLRL